MAGGDFSTLLRKAEADLLTEVWAAGRNPNAPDDGGHFALPGFEKRPISVSRQEARFLALLVSILDCQTVLEIGTGFGYSTAWLAKGLSTCTSPRFVYTVDNFSEGDLDGIGKTVASELWRRTGMEGLIQPIVGTSPAAIESLSDVDVDLVFIDGNHYGNQPVLDYGATRECLSPGGCIVFHDVVERYDVPQAIDSARADGFECIPVNTSCRPVVISKNAHHSALVKGAESLARRSLLIEQEA